MDPNRNLIPRSFFRFPSFPNLWEEMEDRMSQWMGGGENDTNVSVSEDDQNVYVEANLPGLNPDEIDISVHQNTLWIKGEKKIEEEEKDKKFYRRARRSFFYQVDLPSQVEENSEMANYHDGVLKITFRKTKTSQIRKIQIKNESNLAKNKR